MNRRIWELDAARGLALIGMLAVHLLYDLSDMFGLISFRLPEWYYVIKDNFGAVFLVISGISATLGKHPVKRGMQVFACGMLCTAVTFGMYRLGFADSSILIWFGVLHCLGICMLLWSQLQRLPGWALILMGILLAAVGIYLQRCVLETSWVWIPLGIAPWWFASSDYFPLLPNLGFFLLGAAAGRVLYRQKQSRLPKLRSPRALCALGRWSLPVYLLHQPVLVALIYGISYLIKE